MSEQIACKYLPKGTPIIITLKGNDYKGTVISGTNYGTPVHPDWYIEMAGDKGYLYWKQSLDGGTLSVPSIKPLVTIHL